MSSGSGLLLRIITPKGVFYENTIVSLKIRRKDGLMIIYKNYSSVLEQLADGEIVVFEGTKRIKIGLENSWLTVISNRCNIYSTSAKNL